ncbi:MAG: MBL fold metallo-hydrolase [Chloroflexota bacterium]
MGGMRLTVLGSGVAWANPGGVCSGYLLRTERAAFLLDCGTGTLGRLRAVLDPGKLDAIVISHMHADHFLDLIGLRYGTKYGGLGGNRPLSVYVPPGGSDALARLGCALDGNPAFFSEVFAVTEYDPAVPLQFSDATVSLRRVQHYIPSYAMRVQAERSLVFSADVAPCDALIEHARGADVLLCEAAMLHSGQDEPEAEKRGHLTAGEAGSIAQQAGVGRLLITHAPLEASDPGRAAREAAVEFAGPVERVVDGETYTI